MKRFLRPDAVLDAMLALLLAVLCGAVFLNVVLRFGFSSGLTFTEEISRVLLVWLVMLGAVAALHLRGHIALVMFIRRVPAALQTAAAILGLALMLLCDALLFLGAMRQMRFSQYEFLPVTGLPMGLIYASGMVAAAALFAISAWRLLGLVAGWQSGADHFADTATSPEDVAGFTPGNRQ